MSAQRILVARAVAIAADLLQIAIFPIFMEGIMSPVNDVLDVAVALLLIFLVGWHIAFLPTFVAKEVPLLNLAPTWTIAVFVVTRDKR